MDAMPNYTHTTSPRKVDQPQQRPHVRVVKRKLEKPGFNAIDIAFCVATAFVVVFMAMVVVHTSNRAATANSQLATTSASLEKVRNQNNDLKQEVSDLTSPSRLNDIAAKNGLTLQNQNIRNVK
ncbi:cell division protein FtsL [Weissella sp. GP1]|uniref:Cell division protein FtsL n=2 Tax=Weissella TaxID=46255 RepID=A0AAJ3DAG5_WEICO|nr:MULTISPECIES: cell division protein FtsL [Weissella]MBJ7688123.1 cell division protein FtsL [Weissella confusa]MBJ7695025.1 cell division protein FtsL [Weissella confusa]MCW0926221.1 cell division protein FtsL [Weissella sp. LMG 11983]MDF9300226.1 cell division protein FtsL [Weissella sp. BK2]NBA10994.1 cell division protein FtsL [Weissella confusa]